MCVYSCIRQLVWKDFVSWSTYKICTVVNKKCSQLYTLVDLIYSYTASLQTQTCIEITDETVHSCSVKAIRLTNKLILLYVYMRIKVIAWGYILSKERGEKYSITISFRPLAFHTVFSQYQGINDELSLNPLSRM